jgi:hypothetical protein
MAHDQRRHDEILAAAETMRCHYDTLVAALPANVKASDEVMLIGCWIEDVQRNVLGRARTSGDDVTEGRWLALAEMTIQRVQVLLNGVKTAGYESQHA